MKKRQAKSVKRRRPKPSKPRDLKRVAYRERAASIGLKTVDQIRAWRRKSKKERILALRHLPFDDVVRHSQANPHYVRRVLGAEAKCS